MAFLRGGLFISFLVATGLGAQQEGVLPSQSPGNAVATISVTARQVVLDVVVADSRRHPVKGLKQSDFILTEDGVPQTLASFTEHDAADEPPVPTLPVLPPNTFANHAPLVNDTAVTVLVFDTSGLPSADAARARDEVAAYVKKVAPGTPICIFDIDPWGLRLVQDFTTDPKVLRQAVESKNNAQKPYKLPPFVPNHLRLGPPLRQLAGYLASFPGRKNLVWFGGFTPPIAVAGRPGGLFPDLSSFNQADDSFVKDMQSMTATLTLNRVALYTVDPRGVVFDQDRNTLVSIVEGNPKVAAMASGETTFAGDSSDAVIQQGVDNAALTAQTGGKAFFNSNSIDRDVAEVVATGSHYYTVSYAPTNTNWDGSLRTIKVQLVNNGAAYLAGQRPAGQLVAPLHLEYRSGYYALAKAPRASAGGSGGTRQLISYSPKGDPKTVAQHRQVDEAMSFGAVAPFQVLFSAHITPAATTLKSAQLPQGNYLAAQYRHDASREYSIHYSVDPQDLQFNRRAGDSYHDSIEFIAVVYDGYGAIVNSFVNTVPLDVSAADYAGIQQTGVGIELPIAIPAKGDFYLRLGVHDLNSDRVGALEVPTGSIKVLPRP